MKQLNDSQIQALDKVKEILREHFEASVVVINSEIEDHTEMQVAFWHGGYATARGLLEIGKEKMVQE